MAWICVVIAGFVLMLGLFLMVLHVGLYQGLFDTQPPESESESDE